MIYLFIYFVHQTKIKHFGPYWQQSLKSHSKKKTKKHRVILSWLTVSESFGRRAKHTLVQTHIITLTGLLDDQYCSHIRFAVAVCSAAMDLCFIAMASLLVLIVILRSPSLNHVQLEPLLVFIIICLWTRVKPSDLLPSEAKGMDQAKCPINCSASPNNLL